jgi:hypothetical protein
MWNTETKCRWHRSRKCFSNKIIILKKLLHVKMASLYLTHLYKQSITMCEFNSLQLSWRANWTFACFEWILQHVFLKFDTDSFHVKSNASDCLTITNIARLLFFLTSVQYYISNCRIKEILGFSHSYSLQKQHTVVESLQYLTSKYCKCENDLNIICKIILHSFHISISYSAQNNMINNFHSYLNLWYCKN